jgi:hypothetical protein
LVVSLSLWPILPLLYKSSMIFKVGNITSVNKYVLVTSLDTRL